MLLLPANDCAQCTEVCSRSPIALDVAHQVTACTTSTAVRRALVQARSLSRSRCQRRGCLPARSSSRPFCGRADAKKHGCKPVFDHRAPHGSCQAGKPGATCFRRACRRQCPPERRPARVQRAAKYVGPRVYRVQFGLKAMLKYQELLRIRVFLNAFVLAIRLKSSHHHRKEAISRDRL